MNLNLDTLKCADRVVSPASGATLVVNGLSYGRVSVDDVLSGVAKPIEAVLTADGRGYISEWHRGPECGVPEYGDLSVYVERWTRDGRAFHGYVDRESRRIVQTG